jgi:hypothetical protein
MFYANVQNLDKLTNKVTKDLKDFTQYLHKYQILEQVKH